MKGKKYQEKPSLPLEDLIFNRDPDTVVRFGLLHLIYTAYTSTLDDGDSRKKRKHSLPSHSQLCSVTEVTLNSAVSLRVWIFPVLSRPGELPRKKKRKGIYGSAFRNVFISFFYWFENKRSFVRIICICILLQEWIECLRVWLTIGRMESPLLP